MLNFYPYKLVKEAAWPAGQANQLAFQGFGTGANNIYNRSMPPTATDMRLKAVGGLPQVPPPSQVHQQLNSALNASSRPNRNGFGTAGFSTLAGGAAKSPAARAAQNAGGTSLFGFSTTF